MPEGFKKILLFGASGQVGQAILHEAHLYPVQLIPLTHQEADITDPHSISEIFAREKPYAIINAAAYTSVDNAESHPAEVCRVNIEGPAILAKYCKAYDCILLHFSTDYVFDGNNAGAYVETDLPAPLNVYGESKFYGEQAIESIWHKHFILRVSWVFSAYGNNFVKTILRLASTHDVLNVVNDQHGCPTAGASIAAVVMRILMRASFKPEEYGIYHYCDAGATTWLHFAEQIIAAYSKKLMLKTIHPISTHEYSAIAKRPLNSVLNCHKIERIFNIQRFSWASQLERVIKELSSHDLLS